MGSSRAEGPRQYHGEAGSSIPAHDQGANELLNRPDPNTSQAPTIQNSDTQSPIYLLAKDCLRRFDGLYVTLRNSHQNGSQQFTFDLGLVQSTIEDAHTRFRAWGTNIAAFRHGKSRTSLDFRLAEAPRIKYRTVQVLEDLQQYLNEVDLIARGKKINETWGLDDTSDSSDYSDEDDEDQKGKGVSLKGQASGSDIGELLKAITASNASLMKLSIVIRSSATRDDYLKAASRFSSWNPFPDIGHVREKYGFAKYSKNWLLERLGKAITRRRQFLKYRIEHNDRIVGTGPDDENLRDEQAKTIASTKATTFVGENVLQNIRQAGSDAGNTFGSATSYEQTVFQGDGSPTMLTVPPPPKFAFPTRFGFPKIPFEYGQPFQCPYCFTEQTVENRSAWKTHVFRDLKPYVCTFSECEMLMFRSRNEWFAHELQNHRREWACQFCQHSPFTTVSDFSKHTETAHAAVLSSSPLKALIMISEEPIDKISSTACPLCDDWETDMVRKQAILESACPSPNRLDKKDGLHSKPKLFRRHLGRHMEQLALFALPPNNFADLEDGSTDGEREEVDDDSWNKDDDDLSHGLQSASEKSVPHIPELSPTQNYLEEDESRLQTGWSQNDELEQNERVVRDFEFEQQNEQDAKSTKDRELGEKEARETLENDERDSFAEHERVEIGDTRYERRSSTPVKDKVLMTKEQSELEMAYREHDERLGVAAGGRYERQPSPRAPSPQPVIINNRHRRHSRSASRSRSRSSSRHRRRSLDTSKFMTKEEYELEMARREIEDLKRAQYEASKKFKQKEEEKPKQGYREDYELERARKELHKFKPEKQRIEDEKLMKKKLELKLLLKEKEEEEMEAAKKAAEAAVNEYKRKETERALVEKKEKGELDKEYKERLEEDLRKSGLTDQQIATVIEKEKVKVGDQTPPTYTKMAHRHLSYETLNAFRIDYTTDQDPDYIIIKRWVPEHEQDFLWEHTRELRERRRAITSTTNSTELQIEQGGEDHHGNGEVQYEFVRKKRPNRDKSPGLLAFLAGSKP